MKQNTQQQTTNFENLITTITDPQMVKSIQETLDNILGYHPKIGVFGKTGAGKSSLCNALFGEPICEISDIQACTRNPKEIILQTGLSKKITLLDVPGVGESDIRDEEYEQLYASLLPELDLVLWVLKADDRAFSVDRDFYFNVVKPHIEQGKPILFVLNQVDKIEPFREWNVQTNTPSAKQQENIIKKQQNVAAIFKIPSQTVIPVSANDNYNLMDLVEAMIFALPDEKKISVARNIKREHISERVSQNLKLSFTGALRGALIGTKFGSKWGPVGAVIGGIIGGVGGLLGLW